MKIRSGIIICGLSCFLFLNSCNKDKACTGKNAAGEELFIVNGESDCEAQINQQEGEYCDCSSN